MIQPKVTIKNVLGRRGDSYYIRFSDARCKKMVDILTSRMNVKFTDNAWHDPLFLDIATKNGDSIQTVLGELISKLNASSVIEFEYTRMFS